jgi:hypothetical protein
MLIDAIKSGLPVAIGFSASTNDIEVDKTNTAKIAPIDNPNNVVFLPIIDPKIKK